MFKKLFQIIFFLIFNFMLLGVILLAYLLYVNNASLPDFKQLENYRPPVVTRIYASDGQLIEEYAKEHRVFTPINKIPKQLIKAFLAAEDKNFYDHPGLDIFGIARATIQNIINYGRHKKSLVGGSTITQQVVKNFLLTNEKTLNRKIKEAILSFKISKLYSKDRILELYLNQIFLGRGSYGVSSAAQNYFHKSLSELNLEECAFLAALPKAPSNYNSQNTSKILGRRNWVIERMLQDGAIDEAQAKNAIEQSIQLKNRFEKEKFKADFFAESVRKKIIELFGEENLYEEGYFVYTTIVPKLQQAAENAFRKGLSDYDRRHGFRGVVGHLSDTKDWPIQLAAIEKNLDIAPWTLALIDKMTPGVISVKVAGSNVNHQLKDFHWVGSKIDSKLKRSDIVVVEKLSDGEYALRQVPKANGGMVVMNSNSGKVLAMVGGFNSTFDKFNRATQAKRQPGSSIKPLIYLAALERGYTPASLVDDAPIFLNQGVGLPLWSPKNYHHDFLGPTTLRRGIELSRNTMTVRLATQIGVERVTDVIQRFGITNNPPRNYSISLGAIETSLIQMVGAYATIGNGGYKVEPYLINNVQDRYGNVVYMDPRFTCDNCDDLTNSDDADIDNVADVVFERKAITDKRSAYQMTSILEGVIEHSKSSANMRALGRVIAGKTGTTNDNKDAWFVGMTPDLVAGAYIGYDEPKSLGSKEVGATVSQPIIYEFFKNSLADYPDRPFEMPEGIKLVKVNHKTGKPTMEDGDNAIYESFKDEDCVADVGRPVPDQQVDSQFAIPDENSEDFSDPEESPVGTDSELTPAQQLFYGE